jgi:hypothetical protein
MSQSHHHVACIVVLSAILHLAVGITTGHDVAENTSGRVYFWLTLLHNNDGQLQLLNAGDGIPFSDAMALRLIGYDAIAIGRTAGRRVRSTGSGSVPTGRAFQFLMA